MFTRSKLRKLIDHSEGVYQESFDFLAKWKDREINLSSDSLLGFQPRLAGVIHELGSAYLYLANEKKSLIERESNLSSKWFAHRMRTLSADAVGNRTSMSDPSGIVNYSYSHCLN